MSNLERKVPVEPVTLYGSPLSLYTGRVRSYFIKAGIEFREIAPISDHYEDVVIPLAGGRRGMPTMEFADGLVIRDSVAIVDHFEAKLGTPYTPETPKQNTVSLLIDAIASEGLLRPAMHYRWRYPENEPLLRSHFEEITPRDAPSDYTVMGRFKRLKQSCVDLGASEENIPLVESLYLRLLKALDAHFALFPYLLGGKPSIGDFGLIAPMYAHLGRDPKPLSLMPEHGINVLRWVERMHRHDSNLGATHAASEKYLAHDEIPETLLEVLRHFAIDFVPETQAARVQINDWIQSQPMLQSGAEVKRTVGTATFDVEGRSITAATQPFRFYVLKRVQDYVATRPDAQRFDMVELLKSVEMASVLDMTLERDIGRSGNLEVWL
ncbi:MAG: glutathione S-transferase family protein [Proteobacteria bacterium]|nr:glutathione S-transferase family protein [Pseudomonadota bacterium]